MRGAPGRCGSRRGSAPSPGRGQTGGSGTPDRCGGHPEEKEEIWSDRCQLSLDCREEIGHYCPMPPVNRNQPTRAKSSESDYSLMEFMAEFPDDQTCLDWLWRNRYSADGVHATCPKCEQERAFERYATAQQRQSWTCTHCGHHLHPT